MTQHASNRLATQAPSIKVLDKALDLLEAIGTTDHGKSLPELTAELGLPTTTVHRLLQNLARRGYVELDSSRKLYFLGFRVLALRAQSIWVVQLVARARPFLRDMMLATKSLAHLAIFRDGMVVYVDRVDTPESVARFIPVGRTVPAYATALGKILLASLPHEDLEDYIAHTKLDPFTPKTLTDPNQFRQHLNLVRGRNYALDIEEQIEGNWCVAAPIRDYTGRTIAAISVTTKNKAVSEQLDSFIPIVTQTALQISKDLGYKPPETGSGLDLQEF